MPRAGPRKGASRIPSNISTAWLSLVFTGTNRIVGRLMPLCCSVDFGDQFQFAMKRHFLCLEVEAGLHVHPKFRCCAEVFGVPLSGIHRYRCLFRHTSARNLTEAPAGWIGGRMWVIRLSSWLEANRSKLAMLELEV